MCIQDHQNERDSSLSQAKEHSRPDQFRFSVPDNGKLHLLHKIPGELDLQGWNQSNEDHHDQQEQQRASVDAPEERQHAPPSVSTPAYLIDEAQATSSPRLPRYLDNKVPSSFAAHVLREQMIQSEIKIALLLVCMCQTMKKQGNASSSCAEISGYAQ